MSAFLSASPEPLPTLSTELGSVSTETREHSGVKNTTVQPQVQQRSSSGAQCHVPNPLCLSPAVHSGRELALAVHSSFLLAGGFRGNSAQDIQNTG